jgi:hypothetical protein
MFELPPDCLQHTFDIFDHIIVPESDHAVTATRKLGGTQTVGTRLFRMLAAIKLDHQFARWTGEVDDATSNRMLPTKFPRQTTLP